jgi:hypothetical protein
MGPTLSVVLQTPLRVAAIFCSVVVALGWVLFALDESRAASELTVEQIAGNEAARSANPSPDQEKARELAHSDARELVDDVNDVLLAPFAPLTEDNDNIWIRRTVPSLLALIVFGFGLGFLARYATGRSR